MDFPEKQLGKKKQTVFRKSKFHLSESILAESWQPRNAAQIEFTNCWRSCYEGHESSIIRRHKTHLAQRFRSHYREDTASSQRLHKRCIAELVIVLSPKVLALMTSFSQPAECRRRPNSYFRRPTTHEDVKQTDRSKKYSPPKLTSFSDWKFYLLLCAHKNKCTEKRAIYQMIRQMET